MSLGILRRGGTYLRIADPDWQNPLDGSFAKNAGGRWNPPGSFSVVYLNRDCMTARANVRRKFEGLPYGPEDLDPSEAPILVGTEVPEDEFVDIVTDEGCLAAGFPDSYPMQADKVIPQEDCQPLGMRAWEEGCNGIACRSAASATGSGLEELAWFQRRRRLHVSFKAQFEDWF